MKGGIKRMKEITIAKGVKIVLDEECDNCHQLMEERNDLRMEVSELYQLPLRRKGKSDWEQGFNSCLDSICKRRNLI